MKQKPGDDPTNHVSFPGFKELLHRLPAVLGEMVRGKAAGFSDSSELREDRISLGWNEASARTVSNEIEDLVRRGVAVRPNMETWSDADIALAEEIAIATDRAGISNITRTEAYLACYQAYPELHWAFLAHMVSRNAGWNMTDLQGSRIADTMDEEGKRSAYRFIERSNALIFQDAYPQLLLYMKSRELGSSHFHLLPYFHVSRFMLPFWERFWIDRGSALLAVGLIINEQHYIEKRVIKHPYYQKYVTDKARFHLFSLSGLNHIVFPLLEDGPAAKSDNDGAIEAGNGTAERMVTRLAGRVVSDFGSLPARIALGKGLYAMLMGLRGVRSGAQNFAAAVPHSGSRADYWPDIFTAKREEALTFPVQGSELLEAETLPAGKRLYSPKLLDAWGDMPYEPIPREDWLKDTSALDGISAPKPPYLCDISREHRLGILKTALAHDSLADS
ncbi:DUF2515 domain-containing protein [Paenibacillus anaericanus]|uniref:DUF2515 domain-containing protein n=1 Tax=Paenibacillus anaericanus TaxID=170367 RepID=A0A433YFP1_9BACL|nr:DUF2515 family protein [Paenibacillus anaericanus]RUT48709.1 DUF2515 domain-containing protein [Paenibacillus anaericanus]